MKKIIFILILTPVLSFSQNNYLEIKTYFGLQPNNNELKYVSYNQKKIVASGCEAFTDCSNNDPEELLQSLLSAKNYEWDKMNYSHEISKNKDYSKKTGVEFFQLSRSISFDVGTENYFIAKYLMISDNNELPMSTVMRKNNDIWQVISPKENMTLLMFMFKYLSPTALDGIFLHKSINIPTFDNMMKSVYLNDTLLLYKALKMKPNKEYSEEESKIIFGTSNQSQIQNKNVGVDIIFPLSKQSLYKYVDDLYYNSKKDPLVGSLYSKLNIPTENKIIPIFRFNFDYDNKSYIILKIKYLVNDSENEVTSVFVEDDEKWLLYKEPFSDVLSPKLVEIMKNSNINLLESLNMISPKENLNIINRVRNSENYINIDKLSKL